MIWCAVERTPRNVYTTCIQAYFIFVNSLCELLCKLYFKFDAWSEYGKWDSKVRSTRTPKHHHITPIFKSNHWLNIPERIQVKALSLTCNSLQYSQPKYLRELYHPAQPIRPSVSVF